MPYRYYIIVYNVIINIRYGVVLIRCIRWINLMSCTYQRKSCSLVLYFYYLYFIIITFLGSNTVFVIKAINLRSGNTIHSGYRWKKNKIVLLGIDNNFFWIKGEEILKIIQNIIII